MAAGGLSLSEGNARFWVRIGIFGDPENAPEQPERHHSEVACRYALAYDLRLAPKIVPKKTAPKRLAKSQPQLGQE